MRRRLGVAVLAAIVLAALCLGFFAGRLVSSPEQIRASQDAPAPNEMTAEVRRGRLESTVIFRATVTPGRTVAISPVASGLITSLPLAAGSEVRAGTLLMTVNDRPVIVLPGEVPLYRDLRRGDRGLDVERLQAALISAGYPVNDRLGEFESSTESALGALYAAVDREPPRVGRGKGSDRALVASVNELTFVVDLPAVVSKVNGRLGATDLHEVLTLQSTRPGLRGEVNTLDAAQLREGQRVSVEAPSGSTEISARIRSILPSRLDETRGRVVGVVMEPARALGQNLAGSELRVTASTLAKTARLYVPTSAIETGANGTTYVTVSQDGEKRDVSVAVLGEINGRSTIRPTGGRLRVGDEVVIGAR